jgi:hypothetical protein
MECRLAAPQSFEFVVYLRLRRHAANLMRHPNPHWFGFRWSGRAPISTRSALVDASSKATRLASRSIERSVQRGFRSIQRSAHRRFRLSRPAALSRQAAITILASAFHIALGDLFKPRRGLLSSPFQAHFYVLWARRGGRNIDMENDFAGSRKQPLHIEGAWVLESRRR